MSNNGINFKLSGLLGAVVVIGVIAAALFIHNLIYYHNPRVEPLTKSLQSNDPMMIGEALCEADGFTTEKGHKLIPYILPLLRDEREFPKELQSKFFKGDQLISAGSQDADERSKEIRTIGFASALTLQGFIIKDRTPWKKYREKIISYVVEDVRLNDNEHFLKNALWAVSQSKNKRVIPLWFQCLEMESESIKMASLSGLYYYIDDRDRGFFTWHPEKEIDSNMIKKLKACESDSSPAVRFSSSRVIKGLKDAGLNIELSEQK